MFQRVASYYGLPWKILAPTKLGELDIHAPLSSIPNSIGNLKHLQWIVIGLVTKYPFEEDKANLRKLP